MFARSKATQFVVASALALTSLVVPASVASASVAVAPNGTEVAMAWSHVMENVRLRESLQEAA